MSFRFFSAFTMMFVLLAATVIVLGQGTTPQSSDLSVSQRMDIMGSRLDAMRRALNNAISAMNAKDSAAKKGDKKPSADDPLQRLRGLEKEVSTLVSDVVNLRQKYTRAEKFDPADLDKIDGAIIDLNPRVQTALQETASARSNAVASSSNKTRKNPKSGNIFSRLLGRGGGGSKYDELTNTVQPGRDRELFDDAVHEIRKGQYDVGRLLFNTIITTYPDSAYLPMSKLAIADSFYLEGTTSALIQAASGYQDWLTFFPTDPLADDVMLKMAEAEMRQMVRPDLDPTRSKKAEQRLKALLQQYPNTPIRSDVEKRLTEVQENLAMHNLFIARFYVAKDSNGGGGLKGAEDRLREIRHKYPRFSLMDEVLFKLGTAFMREEEPDEAAKCFQELVREWPNSEFVEKAVDQLKIIGAAVPDPNPERKNMPTREKESITQKFFREVAGSVQVTVSKDGVLISRKGEGTDLIDEAAKNGGVVTATAPIAPVNRATPTPRQPKPSATPKPNNTPQI